MGRDDITVKRYSFVLKLLTIILLTIICIPYVLVSAAPEHKTYKSMAEVDRAADAQRPAIEAGDLIRKAFSFESPEEYPDDLACIYLDDNGGLCIMLAKYNEETIRKYTVASGYYEKLYFRRAKYSYKELDVLCKKINETLRNYPGKMARYIDMGIDAMSNKIRIRFYDDCYDNGIAILKEQFPNTPVDASSFGYTQAEWYKHEIKRTED